MDLHVETGSLAGVGAELSAIQAEVMTAAATAAQAGLSGAFSTAPALDMLGAAHGNVLAGAAGSARQVLTALAEQVEWLREAVMASAEALEKQNYAGTHALTIADEGGSVAPGAVVFPIRPPLTPLPFPFPAPVAKTMPTVAALVAAFSGTNLGTVTAAAAAWSSMATAIGEVAARLAAVAGRLGAENRGDVITAGVAKIIGVANAARSFSTNAGVMATQVGKLLGVHQIGLAKVTAAQSMLQSQTDPAMRAASEAAFVAAFPAEFTPIAMTAVPSIRILMNWAEFQGGGVVATGMNMVAPGNLNTPADLSPEAMTARVLDEVVPTRAEVQRVVSEVPELGQQAGEVHQALSATPTQTAAHEGSPAGGSPAVGSPAGGSMTSSSLGSGGAASPVGSSGHNAMAGVSPGSGGFAGLGQTAPGGVDGRGRAGMGSGIPIRTAGTHLASAGAGHSSLRSGGGIASSHAGLPGAGKHAFTAGVAAGALGVAPGSGGGVSRGMSWSTAPAGGGERPVGMMGGMHPQQASRSRNKIKTVTSAVEENENIAALLGTRTPVVPGVIGAWVRG